MSPAAGPLIAKWLPLKGVATIAPIIADISPEIGGAPDATAIPSPKGKATNETLIAAKKSDLKLRTTPFHPVAGSSCISK